ncbi:glycoside hydrolase superfamily [Dipodascopsis tothii]|uniref:glycoside hydrolase superfamily n=1 Tax=Dipodascopsis tothii TaxID=44089 RepID=UPI0034D001CA
MGLNSTWDDSARPNEHVPPLDEDFQYGVRPLRGVNLGGWLILEPFITPSFFDAYPLRKGVIDEYTLAAELGPTRAKQVMEKHYATFVTEETFKNIADAGLDHVRLPYPYWIVDALEGDPYVPRVGWRYLLRAIEWARKYGLRVNLDLHSVPGNANGWNHSGRQGPVEWLNGTHGAFYGNLTLDYHEQLSTFFAQPRYKNIVTLYGLVNEPRMFLLDPDEVIQWTKDAYDIVRGSGFEGKVIFGDGFRGATSWQGVFNESRYPDMLLDMHQYLIFNVDQIALTHTGKLDFVCQQWTNTMAESTNPATGHGPTMVGEFSQADTDCLKYLNNVGVGSRWEGSLNISDADQILTPSCAVPSNCTCEPTRMDPKHYSDAYKHYLLTAAEAQMDAFESNGGWGFMYWTWAAETAEATQWSYERGRNAGILPDKAYERTFNCSTSLITDYAALGLSESY